MSGVEAIVDRVLGGAPHPVVVVAGDLMLDRWWSGPAERMSREAPAPVVRLSTRVDVPGGGANAAVNLAALGARVRLVGAVGTDEGGDRLLQLLDEAGIDTAGIVRVPQHATTVKTRVSGGGQVLVRLDDGDAVPASAGPRIAEALAAALAGTDAVLVCDYGLGTTGVEVRDALDDPDHPSILVVDAHDLGPWAHLNPTAVTPNAGEAERLLGTALGPDRVAGAAAAAAALLARTGAEGVVLTLDRDGTVVHDGRATSRTFARPAPDAMANGAGDTFAAALTLALTAGEQLHGAARFAQLAADVVVRQPGTSVCTVAALTASLADGARLLDRSALIVALEIERAAGRRIVFTNGCFDVLHLGHTAYLKQAKQLGDVLVVAVNDDDSVRRLKGPGRPINGAADRAAVVAELACVDYVTVFTTDTPIPLIREIEPEVYAKGGDYTAEMLEETDVVEGYGGTVRIVDWVSPHSTSSIIARAQAIGDATADA